MAATMPKHFVCVLAVFVVFLALHQVEVKGRELYAKEAENRFLLRALAAQGRSDHFNIKEEENAVIPLSKREEPSEGQKRQAEEKDVLSKKIVQPIAKKLGPLISKSTALLILTAFVTTIPYMIVESDLDEIQNMLNSADPKKSALNYALHLLSESDLINSLERAIKTGRDTLVKHMPKTVRTIVEYLSSGFVKSLTERASVGILREIVKTVMNAIHRKPAAQQQPEKNKKPKKPKKGGRSVAR